MASRIGWVLRSWTPTNSSRRAQKKSIAAIFADEGEAAFREYERQVVAELRELKNTVIATGGGLGANLANLASLKEHALVVCLWATPELIMKRVGQQMHRPLLLGPDPMAKIQTMLAQRSDAYHQADVLLNTERRSVHEVAQHVVKQFRLEQAGRK